MPSDEEIRRVEARFPGTVVELNVHEGMRLSELLHQDSYSYELGVVFVGADSEDDLEDRIQWCENALAFVIDADCSPWWVTA